MVASISKCSHQGPTFQVFGLERVAAAREPQSSGAHNESLKAGYPCSLWKATHGVCSPPSLQEKGRDVGVTVQELRVFQGFLEGPPRYLPREEFAGALSSS